MSTRSCIEKLLFLSCFSLEDCLFGINVEESSARTEGKEGKNDFCVHERGGGMVWAVFFFDDIVYISMKNRMNHCVKYVESCFLLRLMTIIPLSAKRVVSLYSYTHSIYIQVHKACILYTGKDKDYKCDLCKAKLRAIPT